MTIDVIELTKALIACPSVTPKDEGAQELLAAELEKLGFTCWHLPFGEGEKRTPNLFARLGTGTPHICLAGHTDVVPAGREGAWTYGPFTPTIADDGKLYGRGASDMKGSVAAFVASIAAYLDDHGSPQTGSISLLITGDEEGEATYGTVKVLEWMKNNNHVPDMALVGEPTNPQHLGQEIKIGRRGSLSGTITVKGKQGHVAYQHLASNPIPHLAKVTNALSSYEFDKGSEFFLPTNLEFTTIDVGNPARNVIPSRGTADFNVRFSDQWSGESLEAHIRDIIAKTCSIDYEVSFKCSAQSFITKPNEWTQCVQDAVESISGHKPAYTTTGGTSDARFITHYCPTVECGPINESIHQINENADVAVLRQLTEIYTDILKRVLNT